MDVYILKITTLPWIIFILVNLIRSKNHLEILHREEKKSFRCEYILYWKIPKIVLYLYISSSVFFSESGFFFVVMYKMMVKSWQIVLLTRTCYISIVTKYLDIIFHTNETTMIITKVITDKNKNIIVTYY